MGVVRPGHMAMRLSGVVALLLAVALAPGVGLSARHATAATASIALSPAGNLPHAVETISGSGFTPLSAVALTLQNSAGSSAEGTVVADNTGVLSASITLPFTLDVGLANVLSAQEISSTVAVSSTALEGFAVLPSAGNGRQLSAHIGDTVALHVLGFAPRDTLNITIGDASVIVPAGISSYETDGMGSADVRFIVPNTAQPGQNSVHIIGQAAGVGQNDSASVPINVAGAGNLVVTPNSSQVGRTVEIAAGGFAPYEQVLLSFSYVDATSQGSTLASASAKADQAGQLDTKFAIPATAAPGEPATFEAHGLASNLLLSQAITLSARPTIDVVPAAATPGTAVTLSGSGFLAGERVFLTTPVFTLGAGSVVADTTGHFTATTSIHPLLAPGMYSVAASGSDGNAASVQFAVPATRPPHVSVNPQHVVPGQSVQISGTGFQPRERITCALDGVALRADSGNFVATATGEFIARVLIPATVASSGTHTVSVTGQATGASGVSHVDVLLPLVDKTYFAEGFTGDGPNIRFGETLNLLNTSPVTASGMIQYFVGTGMTKTVTIAIPGHSRLVENVGQDVGKNQTVSAIVELDRSVAATRTITRTSGTGVALGASVSAGESGLSNFWYFAEGYTGATFQEYLSLLNPGNTPAQVMVQVFGSNGTSPMAPTSVTVQAHSRSTLNLRALVPNRSIGMLVTSDQSVAAERVLYWGLGSGSSKFGSSVSSGIRGPSTSWTFPYVSTANSDQVFLSFADPTNVAAHVQFTATSAQGSEAAPADITIQPGTRVTVALPDQGYGPLSIAARSDVPIVAEQAQYFGGSPNTGTHMGNVIQGVAPSTQWAFAGTTAGAWDAGAWYVLNTGSTDAQLSGTVYNTSGQTTAVQHVAPAGKLTRIDMDGSQVGPGVAAALLTSSAPVSIVQVLRGSNANVGALISGSSSVLSGS